MSKHHFRGYRYLAKSHDAKVKGQDWVKQHEFDCPACPANFKDQESYKKHWKEKHSDAESVRCARVFVLTYHKKGTY
jgi:hypothetical protein